MHHLYPLKGDPLCPLGFHPQVRWPTRCKRCFRDYKEHGGRKKEDDLTVSTPALSSWNNNNNRNQDNDRPVKDASSVRGWVSSQNLSQDTNKNDKTEPFNSGFGRKSASWTSTPDLSDDSRSVTVSLTLPKKKPPATDTGQNETETQSVVTLRRPSGTPPSTPAHLVINKNDSLAERVRKMQALKAHNSFEKASSSEKEIPKDSANKEKPIPKVNDSSSSNNSNDVNFLIKVKSTRAKPPLKGGPTKPMVNGGLESPREGPSDKDDSDSNDDDNLSTAGTTTTESTLKDPNRFDKEQIESLKEEVETLRKRCEKVEKEKSDILLRRLAALDSSSVKTSTRPSEMVKLQQKINELSMQNEDLKDEKKSMQLKIREIEAELESRPSPEVTARNMEGLRSKLLAAETLCEELMDENEDMKRELRSMEEEIEEMQDNFREDQADEYSSLRKELEQTTKNCRVLSFKLKKTERKAEQLEIEKADCEKKLLELAGGQSGIDRLAKIKQLENDLAMSNEVALRLQKELQEANNKLQQKIQLPITTKKAPTLGAIGKSQSSDTKPSRASLTRGGSQEDPQQLLRDLQDSLEREADLREQLKNAEEESANLRKKASRVEDENETLVMQLKKMASKARSRKLSPTPPTNRLAIENHVEKDEGISDEEDPAELRILLELNEQEASVLRRKVEELEHESETFKTQIKDLTEKLSSTATKTTTTTLKKPLASSKTANLAEEKIKILEGEIAELRKKLIEKERDCERLHAELSVTQKRSKSSLIKSKSLDGASEQQNVDLKRQLQLIEQETAVLSTKIQTLETENEKLQAENKKLQLLSGAKTLKSEKSVEQSDKISQLEKDLEQALGKVKELESAKDKPEKKVSFSAASAKKDAEALKVKQEELDKLKISMKKVETEKDTLAETLKQLKEEAMKSFKPRTPKKPTDFTTKIQMKKMVDELESEIGEMFVIMKNAGVHTATQRKLENENLEKTIAELKEKLNKKDSDMTSEKTKLQAEITKMKESNAKFETDNKNLLEKKKTVEKERDQALKDCKEAQDNSKKLDMQISKLNDDLRNASTKQTAVSDCMKKIEDLKKEIDDKDKQIEKMKKDLEASLKVEQEKNKLIKEVGDKSKKIVDLEKKLKEAEDKCKRTDKMLSVRKERVTKLEKELSEEKEQNDIFVETQRRMSLDWINEKDLLQLQIEETELKLETVEKTWKERLAETEGKVVTLESQLAAKCAHIKQLEDNLSEKLNQQGDSAADKLEIAQIKEKLDTALREVTIKEQEISAMRQEMAEKQQEVNKAQEDAAGTKQDLLKLQHEKKQLDEKLKSQTKETGHLGDKITELEADFQAEKKKVERMKVIHEKDIKNKEIELATLKGKLRTLEQTSGAGSKKITELKKEYDDKLSKLESELEKEKKEYDELTGKYEILEEEHVVTKAKLTIEKEKAQGDLLQLQRETSNLSAELKSLQDTYNAKTDAWIKEKMEMQDKLSSLEERLCGGGWEVEKARLMAKLDQKEREVDHITKERDVSNHLQEAIKRETEELRKKLDDYEKVAKVHRNMTIDHSNLEREVKNMQNKLESAEKSKKSEISEYKLRYESQMQSIQDELQKQQMQVSRFKRERDMYKQMLDSAQKSMSEIKNNDPVVKNNRNSLNRNDELEECKSSILSMQQEIACLEDSLCESKLETSRIRTELVSERSSAEIKLAEMQSKLNEFEEERLVTSGRTKIPGLKTRLELAWQKEREEQQKLLQETSILARDLRQTLYEVERERDKERLEMKRKIDQLKRTSEDEAEENKKKVTELQSDLLELRDAHAKLRTTNEKLRREKERHDREQYKMSIASMKRSQQEEDKKISYMLELVDDLMKSSPEAAKLESMSSQNNNSYLTPTPPRRTRSKSRSREATPENGISEDATLNTLIRLQQASKEVRAAQFSDRQRRQANMRRAASTEPTSMSASTMAAKISSRQSSLKKRSISLEQTTQEQGKIWKTDDDSMSSLQSLDTDVLDTSRSYVARDTSLDSRLSGGSTQSEVLPAEKKKKKGLFGKLKQLTKSRSIDETVGPEIVDFQPIGQYSQGGSDSDMSAQGSKKDLRGRISGMFHRKGGAGGSSSSIGSNSKDKKKELSTPVPPRSDSLQRPLQRNGSSNQLRASPASDRSTARAISVTPGVQRKAK